MWAQVKRLTTAPSQLWCYIITGHGGHSARSRSWFFGIFYLRNLSAIGQKPIHVSLKIIQRIDEKNHLILRFQLAASPCQQAILYLDLRAEVYVSSHSVISQSVHKLFYNTTHDSQKQLCKIQHQRFSKTKCVPLLFVGLLYKFTDTIYILSKKNDIPYYLRNCQYSNSINLPHMGMGMCWIIKYSRFIIRYLK